MGAEPGGAVLTTEGRMEVTAEWKISGGAAAADRRDPNGEPPGEGPGLGLDELELL